VNGYLYGNSSDQARKSFALKLTSSSAEFKPFDATKWHKVEDQGQQGSCQGHMLSSILEGLYIIENNGQKREQTLHLSRNAAYRFSQEEDGIRGDQGSTLSGGIAAALKGLPLEKYFPYTTNYSHDIPTKARETRDYKLITHRRIESAEDLSNAMSSGLFLGGMGIKWTDELDSQKVISKYRASGFGGGHAVALLGQSDDSNHSNPFGPKVSEPYFMLPNSWGLSWGQNGWKKVTFDGFNKIVRHGWNAVFAYSDLADLEPRPMDFSIITDILK
jgi:C1A family cysteine protease